MLSWRGWSKMDTLASSIISNQLATLRDGRILPGAERQRSCVVVVVSKDEVVIVRNG